MNWFHKLHRSTKFLFFSVILIGVYILLSLTFPQIERWIYDGYGQMKEYALANGLKGMFILAILANATVFISIPYSSVAVLLAALGLNPFAIALVAGVGAMVGEVVDYLIGVGSGRLLTRGKEETIRSIRRLIEHRRNLAPLFIFIFGATPIPDYILLIPLGIIRYSFLKLLLFMTLGKIVQNLYFAILGRSSANVAELLEQTGGQGGFYLGLISLLLILGAIYLILRIDWERLVEKWTKDAVNV